MALGTALGIVGGVAGGLLVVWHLGIWYEVDVKCEKPKYTLLRTLPGIGRGRSVIELRRYAPQLVASYSAATPDMRTALSSGFRNIAGFIFGKNTAPGAEDQSAKVAMTSPVTLEAPSAKIAMTSPVTAEVENEGRYTVSFIMPSKYTKDTLPRPQNAAVHISEVPARTLAAVGWRGRSPTEAAMQTKADEVKAALKAAGLAVKGNVHLWQYHPPFAPAWMRKNEVLVEVDEDATPVSSS